MMRSGRLSSKDTVINRRKFLTQIATVTGIPFIVPSRVLGLNGYVAPNERIVVGGIGIGPRGIYDLRWMLPEKDVQFVAVCDPQRSRREAVKNLVDNFYNNKDCKTYADIREFLAERNDIDAVLIATGDRWHALASIWAMRAGKDVYCEKPSCMTIAEGQAVVETAKRYGRVYQTGTQRLSEANFIFANELVRLGWLGQVHTVRAHIAPWDAAQMRHDWLPEEPLPPKEEVDWDAWLGPCPWRPYNSAYVRGGWRGFYDFHTSCIGEWGAHTFAQCQVAIGKADTSPIEYYYIDNPYGDGMVTVFDNGIKMILQRGGWKGSAGGWQGSCGVCYEGTEGWVSVADGYSKPQVSNPMWLRYFTKIVREYTIRTGRPLSHMRDWLDCIKSRRQPVANPEVMYYSMCTVHAANICMWLKRDLRFDPKKAEFINDQEANRLRSRAMRPPWTI